MGTKNNDAKKGGVRKYFKSVKAELKKVSWPTKKEVTSYTGVVLAMVFISAVAIGLLDAIFKGVFQLLA